MNYPKAYHPFFSDLFSFQQFNKRVTLTIKKVHCIHSTHSNKNFDYFFILPLKYVPQFN